MKSRFNEFLYRLLLTQYNHWCLFGLVLGAMYIGMAYLDDLDRPYFLWYLIIGIVPFLQKYVRDYMNKFFLLFLIMHAGIFSLVLFLPYPCASVKVIGIVVGVYYTLYSIKVKMSEETDVFKPYKLIVGYALAFVGVLMAKYTDSEGYENSFLILSVIVTSLYFLSYLVDNYRAFLRSNTLSAGVLPSKKMFSLSIKMYGIYLAVGGAFALLVINSNYVEKLLGVLKKGALALIRFLFRGGDVEEQEIQEIIEETEMQPSSDSWEMGPVDDNVIWKYIWIFFGILMCIIVCFAGFMLIRHFIRGIRENFSSKTKVEGFDIREKVLVNMSDTRKKYKKVMGRTIDDRIRKVFKNSMINDERTLKENLGIEKGIDKFTASEYGNAIHKEEATLIYEKARYSGENCTKEDLNQIKKLCK